MLRPLLVLILARKPLLRFFLILLIRWFFILTPVYKFLSIMPDLPRDFNKFPTEPDNTKFLDNFNLGMDN